MEELMEMLKGVDPPEMCEVHEQCIYKVPPVIREAHPETYTPKIISIGPFHNPRGRGGNKYTNILWSMEDLKLKYLKGFLNRTKLSVMDFDSKLKELEDRIRNCYAEPIIYNSNDFLKIIITDACFIIELFLRDFLSSRQNDPILSKFRLSSDIRDDLLLLENQLPFFVLEEIFKSAGLNRQFPSFVPISIQYFELDEEKELKKEYIIKIETASPKHFIDLLIIFSIQSSLPPPPPPPPSSTNNKNKIDHVYSPSQLLEAGLKFEVRNDTDCLLDLEFDETKGVLKMPPFVVRDNSEIYYKNILVFEDCHRTASSAYISQYLRLLDLLINTEKDASILVEAGIIINYMGDISSVATMINSFGKNVYMPDLTNSRYHSLCLSLNGFYENPRNKYKAIFIHDYFNTPWKIASTIAAILLLLLTLIQTICSVWSLLKE